MGSLGTETNDWSDSDENQRGFWLPYGCTFIYRDGTEYIRPNPNPDQNNLVTDPTDPDFYENIFPFWDWSYVPGVTCPDLGNGVLPGDNDDEDAGYDEANTQLETFVGNASNDSYGVSTMSFNKDYPGGTVNAKKAWFHFGEEVIALGADIYGDHALHTTMNQCLLDENAQAPLPVVESSGSGTSYWINHDGIAYILPNGPLPSLTTGAQSGDWSDIDDCENDPTTNINECEAAGEGKVFKASVNHGTPLESDPQKYFYIIAPGQDAADYIGANAEVSVIRNNNLSGSYIQAVKKVADNGDVLVGIIYYPHPDADGNSDPFMPTYVPITGGLEFKTNKPCALLYDEINSEICISSPDRESPTIILTANSPDGTDYITFSSLEEGKTTCIGFSFPTITAHNIHSHCTDQGVANVDILTTINNNNISLGVTDLNGDYNISDFTAPTATLTPSSNNAPTNGVTAWDLWLISRHILEIEFLDSPYKMIAADANRSEDISTMDMLHIRKVILRIDEVFENNTSWRFVRANYEFPIPTDPWYIDNGETFPESVAAVSSSNFGLLGEGGYDFKGVKIGDVNCTANNQNEEMLGPGPDIIIVVEDKTVVKDEIVRVPMRVTNFSDVGAYQLGIEFNSEVLEKQSIDLGDLNRGAESENFGLTEVENGNIRSVWLQNDGSDPNYTVLDTSLVDNSSLFEIEFKAKMDFTRASSAHKLSDLLRLNDDILANRAYSQKGEHNIKLVFVPEGSFDKIESGGALLSPIKCFPNPAEEQINFQLDLRTESNIQFQIFDPIGKLVTERELSLPAGVQTIDLKNLKGWDDGLYYYTIRIGEEMESGKFVKQ